MKILVFTYLLITTLFNHQIPKDNVVLITKAESHINTTVNVVPTCTTLDDFRSNIGISWIAVPGATGYLITIGTTSGGSDIANMVDVINTNVYNSPMPFPNDTKIFVTIIPYNDAGQAIGCPEENFFVNDSPGCSNMSFPEYNAMNVPVDTNISWTLSPNTTGYTIGIGTAIGSDDILNTIDVGYVTTFNPPFDLPINTEIHITITSYNNSEIETVCGADMFTTGSPETLDCNTFTNPLNNDTGVLVTTDLTWNAVGNATGYILSIGTTSGGTELINMIDVGNVLSYTPMNTLPENTQLFASVFPYNASGEASGCPVVNFRTEELTELPDCSSLSYPLNGTKDVSVTTDLTWNAVGNATGYILSIGTTSGGTELINMIDVGNVLSYTPMNTLPENTQLFASVFPYNASGEASGCPVVNFRTEELTELPDCSSLSYPLNGTKDVSVTTDLTWNAVGNATGYILSIGTTSGGTELINMIDVGNVLTYTPINTLPENTQLFATVFPYNTSGEASGCLEQTFTTESFTIETPTFFIPNYFTPNGDFINDVWKIEDPENQIYIMNIFDRYGKLLKSNNTGEFNWDGNYNNKALPASDYWYIVQLHSGENLSGHFTLKR